MTDLISSKWLTHPPGSNAIWVLCHMWARCIAERTLDRREVFRRIKMYPEAEQKQMIELMRELLNG